MADAHVVKTITKRLGNVEKNNIPTIFMKEIGFNWIGFLHRNIMENSNTNTIIVDVADIMIDGIEVGSFGADFSVLSM